MQKMTSYLNKVNTLLLGEKPVNQNVEPSYTYSKKFLDNNFDVNIYPNTGGIIIKLKINDFEKYIETNTDLNFPLHLGILGVHLDIINLQVVAEKISFNFSIKVVIGSGSLSKKITLVNTPISFKNKRQQTAQIADNKINTPVLPTDNSELKIIKFYALINLIKSDGNIEPHELDFFNSAIECAFTDKQLKTNLLQRLHSPEIIEINYSLFENNQEAKINLIITLVELAKRNTPIVLSERLFISSLGKKLGFSDDDIHIIIESI